IQLSKAAPRICQQLWRPVRHLNFQWQIRTFSNLPKIYEDGSWTGTQGSTAGLKTLRRFGMKRSDLVFEALHTLRNRYMLCQLASKATRKFHKPNTRIQETMNEVLDRIASSKRQSVLA